MFKLFNKKTPEVTDSAATAQEWLPIKDIKNSVIVRNDDHLIGVLRVEPLNISLKSDTERKRIIGGVHEAMNGHKESFQIFCLGRPVDLDAYIQGLEEKYRYAPDIQRKGLLREYLRYVGGIASGGEALEHRYYILLSQAPDKQALDDLIKRCYELAGNLSRSGLEVNLCSEREVIDFLFTFTHPVQSAYEKAPDFPGPFIPTQLAEGVL